MNVSADRLGDPLEAESQRNMCDSDTQTPTHFVESYKDYTYTWNEWDLRREAIKTVKSFCRNVLTQARSIERTKDRMECRPI